MFKCESCKSYDVLGSYCDSKDMYVNPVENRFCSAYNPMNNEELLKRTINNMTREEIVEYFNMCPYELFGQEKACEAPGAIYNLDETGSCIRCFLHWLNKTQEEYV